MAEQEALPQDPLAVMRDRRYLVILALAAIVGVVASAVAIYVNLPALEALKTMAIGGMFGPGGGRGGGSNPMAVAPVAEVRLYDTIYQERYMGLPQDNPEDYAQSSPLTYADRLEGDLLVVHGTGDDNVHFQGTERLINALVAANKPFQMMAYPNRTHGIWEGENTTLHLYSLLTRYLEEHVPPGPAAAPARAPGTPPPAERRPDAAADHVAPRGA